MDPTLFFKNIGDAGYQARRDDVRFTMTGMLSKEGDTLLLTVSDVKPGPQVFALAPATSKDAKEQAAFTAAYDDLAKRVGQSVTLEAFWKPPAKKEAKAVLLVRKVEPATGTP